MKAHRRGNVQLESLERRRLLSAGDLDPTFGTGGRLLSALPAGAEIEDELLLSDDKTLLAGGAQDGDGDLHVGQYFLARYNADGTPDASFGDHGDAIGSLQNQSESEIVDINQQPDGKLLAVITHSGIKGVLARFNADGSLDTSFGTGGVVELGDDAIGPLTFYPDGKFLLGRFHENASVISRFNADGTIDTSFADNGTTDLAIDVSNLITMAVLPSEKILLGGCELDSDPQQLKVVRLNIDGSLDTTFGDDGQVFPQVPGQGSMYPFVDKFALLDNGQFLAAGIDDQGMLIVRLNEDGTVDPTFGNSGTLIPFGDPIALQQLQLDDQGRAILIGEAVKNSPRVTVSRVNTDGTLDSTFGRVILADPFTVAGGGIDSQGKIVVAGRVQTNDGSALIAHLLTSGNSPSSIALDPQSQALSITGTGETDTINVSASGGNIIALLNNDGRAFAPADVKSLSIAAGSGDDSVSVNPDVDAQMTIDGGDGNDAIGVRTSTSMPVVILGGAGNDTLNTDDANSPTVHGGDGNDAIKSGQGQQFLYGDGGSDTIHAGEGSDLVNGGGGKDHLFGQQGKDRLYGGNGDDAIDGGSGDDRINGGAGTDKLFGGSGGDSFNTVDGEKDFLFGNGGFDSADADPSDMLTSIESTF